MLSRTQWKKLKGRIETGIPAGERVKCECGGMIIVERKAEAKAVMIHHSLPTCALFDKIAGKAEFLTLSAADAAEMANALEALGKKEN